MTRATHPLKKCVSVLLWGLRAARTTLCAAATVSHPRIPESHQLSQWEILGTCSQPCCSGHQGTWDKDVCFFWETLDSVQPRTHYCKLLKVIATEAEKLLLDWTPPTTCPFFLAKNGQCAGWNEPCSEEQDWQGSQHWSSFTHSQELSSLHQLASRQHQHVEGGPEEDGCGGQVVQEKTMTFVYLSSFPRAGITHKFLYQLLPSWGLETENNELILCQNRECEGCGRRLRST